MRSLCFDSLNEHRDRVAAAETERGDADATASAFKGMEQRDEYPGSTRADRVAKRDRPAVNVHAFGRDSELMDAREHLHGECFVDFEQVNIVERATCFGDDAADGFDGRGEQILRLTAGGGGGDDSRERLAARARLPIRKRRRRLRRRR